MSLAAGLINVITAFKENVVRGKHDPLSGWIVAYLMK